MVKHTLKTMYHGTYAAQHLSYFLTSNLTMERQCVWISLCPVYSWCTDATWNRT